MLIVETQNHKFTQLLEAQFHRDGHSFAIPYKKIDIISQALDLITYELEQKHKQKEAISKLDSSVTKQIKSNLTLIIQNAMRLHFSLDLIKETLGLFVEQEKIIERYTEYIEELDQIYGSESDEGRRVHFYDEELCYGNAGLTDYCNQEKQGDEDLHHRSHNSKYLKLQIAESPKFFSNNPHKVSDIWSNYQSSPKHSEIDRDTDSTLYETPEEKRNRYKLSYVNCSEMYEQVKTIHDEGNSERFLPSPSILLDDENISKMTEQERKHDIERSKALNLKTSKKDGDSNKGGSNKSSNKSIEQKMYSQTIKMIKIGQKMRSTSRKMSNKSIKDTEKPKKAQHDSFFNNQCNYQKKVKKSMMSSIAQKKNSMVQKRDDRGRTNLNLKISKDEQINSKDHQPLHSTKSSDKLLFNFFKTAEKNK